MQVSRTTHQAGLYRALGSRSGGFAAHAAQLRTPRSLWFGYAEPQAFSTPSRTALARTRMRLALRSAFIADQLRAAVADGITQVVWLGLELPCPPELSRIQLSETDLINLAKPSAEPGALEMALAAQGLRADERCIFVWDGLLERPALSANGVQRVLSCIGRTCPGSRFVFTYLHRGLLDGSVRFDASQKPQRAVPRLGHAAQFGLDPRALPAFLSQLGLVLDSDSNTDEYAKRTAQPQSGRRADLRGYGFHRLACAHVIGR